MISEKKIKQFQYIYRAHFGKEISREDVLDRGRKLVRLMQIIYQPITKEQCDKIKNNDH